MVQSTVTNLDVFVEGVTAHWPLLLWENFVKEKKNGFEQDSYSSHQLDLNLGNLHTYTQKNLCEQRKEPRINLNMAWTFTHSSSIIQELRSRLFLQITSFFLMYCLFW